jgi:AMP deaminase
MSDTAEAAALRECLALRAKFMTGEVGGLDQTAPYVGPIFPEVLEALGRLQSIIQDPLVRKMALKQLSLNELTFDTFQLENETLEREQAGTDAAGESFYSVPKVDTHLHLTACMSSAELFDYLHEIYTVHGEREIPGRDATTTTIKAMMDAEGFTPGRADVDEMATISSAAMNRNFEAFNQAFQPFRSKALKDLVFRPSTLDGEFYRLFITRVVDKAKRRNIFLEPRTSIAGCERGEWESLAKWVHKHKEEMCRPNLLWGIQLPRVYQVHYGRGKVGSFGELVTNFFAPLFEATLQPEANTELAWFLEQVGIIDTVDNEDHEDGYELNDLPAASEYTRKDNPPYGYYHFYFWANLRALNKLRAARKMRVLTLRPHCGEAVHPPPPPPPIHPSQNTHTSHAKTHTRTCMPPSTSRPCMVGMPKIASMISTPAASAPVNSVLSPHMSSHWNADSPVSVCATYNIEIYYELSSPSLLCPHRQNSLQQRCAIPCVSECV